MPRYGMASAAKLLSSASHGLAASRAIGPDLRTNPTFSGHVRPVCWMDTPGSGHPRLFASSERVRSLLRSSRSQGVPYVVTSAYTAPTRPRLGGGSVQISVSRVTTQIKPGRQLHAY
ncbi:hypothetical protein BD311DRAFT_767234, partial [Dichomitus squalens]